MKAERMLTMGWAAFRARCLRKRQPINVMLSVTNQCPGSCIYCRIPQRQTRELSCEDIRRLIDQICLLGCQRLGVWGGEPLVRNDIEEILAYAKSKKLYVTLDSNGFLLPSKAGVLKSIDHLLLPLDGDKDGHDANRGKGSFEKTLAAIRVASGKVPLWTITVLTKHNLASIDSVLATARRHHFLTTFQILHHNDVLGAPCEEGLPSDKEYREAIVKIIQAKKGGSPIASSFKYLNHLLSWPTYRQTCSQKKALGIPCWAGRLYCNVDTDGSVYPCSLKIGKIPAVNFLENGFRAAWETLDVHGCQACVASCFTEYNHLFSLELSTLKEWYGSLRRF